MFNNFPATTSRGHQSEDSPDHMAALCHERIAGSPSTEELGIRHRLKGVRGEMGSLSVTSLPCPPERQTLPRIQNCQHVLQTLFLWRQGAPYTPHSLLKTLTCFLCKRTNERLPSERQKERKKNHIYVLQARTHVEENGMPRLQKAPYAGCALVSCPAALFLRSVRRLRRFLTQSKQDLCPVSESYPVSTHVQLGLDNRYMCLNFR